ncbi:hypothetical protein C8R44DRAFT_884840 [Mycena epipterygia]|nr:hypothetical protein C8R44DRAFT_884840 [Mycena epipterygia]
MTFIQDRLSICNAPALHTAHLYGCVPPLILTLPWHQLTDFLGEFYTVDQCPEVLRQSPCLIKCSFIEVSHTNAGDLGTTPLSPNSFLQSLTLSNEDVDMCPHVQVLVFLIAPALEELDLDYIWDYPPLIRFLSQHPSLHKIRLSLAELEMHIFHLLPALVSLDLELYDTGEPLSQFFTLFRTSPSFLPNITTCAITLSVQVAQVDYTLLVDALASRWHTRSGVAKLQHFIFTHCEPEAVLPDALVLNRMSELIQQGMSLRLETKDVSWP